MHQAENTLAALMYNEYKVEQKHARFFHTRNAKVANAFKFTKAFRVQVLKGVEDKNKRVKNKCLHISVNPTQMDLLKMTENDLRNEMDHLMKNLGYHQQPYFIYKHGDIDRTHFHIVSTRIDIETSKKIKDANEKRKVNAFVKELEEKYKLDNTQNIKESINLIPNATSPDLMTSVQEVFKLLNRSNISSLQEYQDILKAFNIEIDMGERGQAVLIKDQDGTTLRHSIKMSDFKERAKLDFTIKPEFERNNELQQVLQDKTKQVMKELITRYRFFTAQELRAAFIRNNLIPFQLLKNGNYNIYSPNDLTVVDAQFLIKKYSVRLMDFAISNHQFYAIAREYTDQLLTENKSMLDALLDKETNILNAGQGKPNMNLKELDFSHCEEYNATIASLDGKAQNELNRALKSHFEYLLNQAVRTTKNQPGQEYSQAKTVSLLERINQQFLFELMNYWRKGSYYQHHDRKKRKQFNQSKRKRNKY